MTSAHDTGPGADHPGGIPIDFDGSGHPDAVGWDTDGDGRVDTILVSTHHDGVYDTAYYDPSGTGRWDVSEPVDQHAPAGGGDLTYSFGDDHTATQTYSGAPDVDVDGDGRADGIRLDFDGSGHRDAIAWDSDGDGRVDTILVSSHHDGVYDTAYHDPSGQGHWDEAESVPGVPVGTAAADEAGVHDHETSHVVHFGAEADVAGTGVTDLVDPDLNDLGHPWPDELH